MAKSIRGCDTGKRLAVLRAAVLGTTIALAASACGSVSAETTPHAAASPPRSPSGSSSGIAASHAANAASLAAGSWSTLPAAPIAPRHGASVVWTGTEMLVWGGASGAHGGQLHADGAAYDPASRTWQLLPPAPISPRTGQMAVWAGRQMVIWGGYTHVSANAFAVTGSGAAYDPATNRWHTLPPAPLSPRADALGVWTGTVVLVLGGQPAVTTATTGAFGDGAAYDPSTRRWSHVAAPAHTGSHPLDWVAAIQARGEILAWSMWSLTRHVGPSIYSQNGGTNVYRYQEPTSRWQLLRSSPGSLPTVEDVIWTGREAIVRGITYNCGACSGPFVPEATATYDPASNTSARLPPDPLGGDHLASAWTGAALFSFDAGGIYGSVSPGAASVYDPTTNSWQRTPSAPFACDSAADPLWTGHQILMYCPRGGSGISAAHDGLAFTPGS